MRALLLLLAAVGGLPEPKLEDAESYSEAFTTIVDLDDGTYVQVQLALSNLGSGDGHGVCRILIVPRGKPAWTAALDFKREEWLFTRDPNDALIVGTCQASVTGDVLLVSAELNGASVHLSLAARVAPVAPPGNHVTTHGSFYTWEILVPWAEASARLAWPGAVGRTVSGHGYADHSRSTLLPAKLARGWLRFRGLQNDCGMLFLARLPPKRGDAVAWLWPRGADRPQDLGPTRAELGNARDKTPILVKAGAVSLTFRPESQLYRHAPVEEYTLGRMIGFFVGSPVTTTYRATVEGGPCAPLAGILEVTQVTD